MNNVVTESAKRLGIGPKDKIVVAVSGGVDSVVLLNLCAQIFDKNNLIIAHVNHGLRKESVREEKFIAKLAKKYGIHLEVTRLNLGSASEETSRNKRYEFLRTVKEKHKAKYVALAHHLNDQVETVLLKMVRGSGPTELWGMKELENDLWRPLLTVPKTGIEKYAQKNKIEHTTDKSNRDLKFARNRIRHNIVPELLKLNPNFMTTSEKEIQLGQELASFIDKETKKALRKVKTRNEIDIKKLLYLDPYMQKQVIYTTLKELTPRPSGIYQKNVEEILRIVQSKGGKTTKINRFTIVKNYDKIIFDFKPKSAPAQKRILLGKTNFENWRFTARISNNDKAGKNNILLPLNVKDHTIVRPWKTGDKIKTLAGTKKVQDIFTDSKVPLSERKTWPIVEAKGKILWVVGLQAYDGVAKDKKLKFEVQVEKIK